MHSRFDRFRCSPIGQQLEAAIELPERYIEFAALSRVGVAAIAAIADEISEKFPEVIEDTTARQFCGAMVAEVMRRKGHEVVQARGRVSGAMFSYGAVFSPYPIRLPFADVIAALTSMPGHIQAVVARLDQDLQHIRPAGTGFSLAEHVCHLRDLDTIFAQRFKLVLTSTLPQIASVDGTALAVTRDYQNRDIAAALQAFSKSRARMCAALNKLEPQQLVRCGLRDGVRRMTLEELVRELLDHDRTHCLELEELAAELQKG